MVKQYEIYTQFSVEEAASYDPANDLILNGYELAPRAYRRKFRNCEKVSCRDPVSLPRDQGKLNTLICVELYYYSM